jgi:diguanylate cyclase (GGDEF)-like protein
VTGDDPVRRPWIVLLEAADEGNGSVIDPETVDRLAAAWADVFPTTLHSPSRYAMQVRVEAPDPPSALAVAIRSWNEAISASGAPRWELVRSEVLTPEELEVELRAAERTPDHASTAPVDPVADDLLRRALHDRLTGLPNREIFLHAVGRVLAGATTRHVVVAVGLEPFGGAATYGTDRVNDEVVLQVAHRLSAGVRDGDVLARVGPAGFALLVDLGPAGNADRLGRRLLGNVLAADLRDPDGHAVVVSVGVATTPGGGDADELLVMAETAMHAAREDGGNCHRQFPVRPGGQ